MAHNCSRTNLHPAFLASEKDWHIFMYKQAEKPLFHPKAFSITVSLPLRGQLHLPKQINWLLNEMVSTPSACNLQVSNMYFIVTQLQPLQYQVLKKSNYKIWSLQRDHPTSHHPYLCQESAPPSQLVIWLHSGLPREESQKPKQYWERKSYSQDNISLLWTKHAVKNLKIFKTSYKKIRKWSVMYNNTELLPIWKTYN